jgi:chromosome segregation ATPase
VDDKQMNNEIARLTKAVGDMQNTLISLKGYIDEKQKESQRIMKHELTESIDGLAAKIEGTEQKLSGEINSIKTSVDERINNIEQKIKHANTQLGSIKREMRDISLDTAELKKQLNESDVKQNRLKDELEMIKVDQDYRKTEGAAYVPKGSGSAPEYGAFHQSRGLWANDHQFKRKL